MWLILDIYSKCLIIYLIYKRRVSMTDSKPSTLFNPLTLKFSPCPTKTVAKGSRRMTLKLAYLIVVADIRARHDLRHLCLSGHP